MLLGEINVVTEIVDEGADHGRQLRVEFGAVEVKGRRDFEEEISFS